MTLVTAGDIDALRAAGLTVKEVRGWEHRGHGPGGPVQGLDVHHTAGSDSDDHGSLEVVIGGRPDLGGPLCNYLLARSGTLYVVAAGEAWHAGAVRYGWADNENAIGVEVQGSGKRRFTKAQRKTLIVMGAVLGHRKDFPASHIGGHREVCYPRGRKIDPRIYSMTALRRAVRAYKLPTKKGVPFKSVVKAMQSAVGVVPDGVPGPKTRAALVSFRDRARAGKASKKQLAAVRKALGLNPALRRWTKPTAKRFAAFMAKAY